jgi:uncharacterized protein YeaO (DUF488 family)
MYYISYFANIKNIPENVEVVGIVNTMPKWVDDRKYRNIRDLAPTDQILRLWKSGKITWNEYQILYVRDVLSQLDFSDIISQLGDKDVCMCCYEVNGSNCHRYLVKRWFENHGVEVKEVENK